MLFITDQQKQNSMTKVSFIKSASLRANNVPVRITRLGRLYRRGVYVFYIMTLPGNAFNSKANK